MKKLNAPENLINREMSWLEFNTRVLHEGLSDKTPLLERLKFLAIVSSNLDEFFMVRVGGLTQLAKRGERRKCPAGMTPRQQIREISKRAHEMVRAQYACLREELMPALEAKGIIRMAPQSLSAKEYDALRWYFDEEIFPILTPIAASEDVFQTLSGLTNYLAVRLKKHESSHGKGNKPSTHPEVLGLIALPRSMQRFIQVLAESGYRYVLLEDLVQDRVNAFFPGYEVLETTLFRITRNANLPLQEEEGGDLLDAMQDVLRGRLHAAPLRLEIDAHAGRIMTKRLVEALEINQRSDLYRIDGPLDLKPFMGLAAQMDFSDLRYPPYQPQPSPVMDTDEPIWDIVRREDVIIHHPYEAFQPVIQMVSEAAEDPQTIAIKQTLYRTSSNSPIIDALERAALNGKQVTVMVEVKARFDEEQNIQWANRLVEAGAQVIYGILRLKTHSKALMVVRREADGVRRYLHLATGNYNEKTAALYEDIGLITSDEDFGSDGSNFFNAVSGYSEPREWRRLAIAPTHLRRQLEEMIDREISCSTPETPGLILAKMNSLLDPEICRNLYKASQAGVKIKLCVRGICCLRPGLKGISENIEVISVVDRFLEHSRIFYFQNSGQEEIYLASADWMPRNLDRRVEIMFPIVQEAPKERVIHILKTALSDNQKAWVLNSDGSYSKRDIEPGALPIRCQEVFMKSAQEAARAWNQAKRATFQPRGPGTAPGL